MLATELISLQNLFSLRFALPVILLVSLWTWESVRPFCENSPGRGRHALRNITIAVVNAIVTGALFGASTVFVADWTVENSFGLLQFTDQHAIGRFFAGLILLDLWMYVWHRLNHHIPLLWRFHRMHHSDSRMDVTTATRFHIGEHMISAGLRLLLIPLLGVSIWQIVAYEMGVVAMTHFHHANISIGRADHVLRWLVVTPDMHKIHHSRWQPETDSNYAVVLSIWDRIACSFRMREDVTTIDFGLDEFENERWQTIGGMLKTPFANSADLSAPKAAEPEIVGEDRSV
ncbi:sterol desaturase family protein [Fuerstiella marisgermanici]|uniref:Fatty acid hydroxylase superfamily protein n=1 Tax=Fuerstiella marisgermanici TaxID=1891926 RepID=A0A1P8WQU8_9PLAN|nr:sterol desaturase family protein [Fuerstiella marisgermanici]APZ96436.1 Fatty acid hydroxylase superfamily protein [Fuerstiella marisgermanici]